MFRVKKNMLRHTGLFLLLVGLILMPVVLWAQEYGEERVKSVAEEVVEKAVIRSLQKQEREVLPEEGMEMFEPADVALASRDEVVLAIDLEGLTGSLKGKQFATEQVYGKGQEIRYDVGDVVYVSYNDSPGVEHPYLIIDFDRTGTHVLLAVIFVVVVVLIGWWHGIKALLGLGVSLLALVHVIIPLIISGHNPVLIGFVGMGILVVPTYLITHGIGRVTWIAIAVTLLAILCTQSIAIVFMDLYQFSGFSSEEALYLSMRLGEQDIDLRGILLLGIVIGTLGVLDDVAVSQVAITQELYDANDKMPWHEVFFRSMRVGRYHAGSMVNSLVLAYAGSSLPLFILFTLGMGYYRSFDMIVNNEVIAIEIARSLIGSIGLLLALPIASLLGSWFLQPQK